MRLAAPPGWEKKKNKREKDPGKNHGANPFVSYQEKNLKTEKKQKEAERSRSLKKSKKEVWEGRKR